MTDQATVLRGLMEQRSAVPPMPGSAPAEMSDGASRPTTRRRVQTIAVTSGKGGAGKSVVALNLALALAEREQRVCLLDASFGLGNLDLLCGLNGYWNLAHVVSGARRLPQVVLPGPQGVDIVPGAGSLVEGPEHSPGARQDLLQQLGELEQSHDVLIIDTGTGIRSGVRRLMLAADVALVLTTPEPTSVANAYAVLKSMPVDADVELRVLVNRASSEAQASQIIRRLQETSRLFLHHGVDALPHLPDDPAVAHSVQSQQPAVLQSSQAPFATAMRELAALLHDEPAIGRRREPYFHRLLRSAPGSSFSPAAESEPPLRPPQGAASAAGDFQSREEFREAGVLSMVDD